METSKPTSPEPSRPVNNKWGIFFLVFALLGFLDASFLTLEHYLGATPACTIVHGCETVLSGKYSTIGPIPVALLGACYYLLAIILSIYFLDSKNNTILRWLSFYSTLGLLASLYFVFLQLFVIHALCLYCMFSAVTSTLLFLTGAGFLLKRKSL